MKSPKARPTHALVNAPPVRTWRGERVARWFGLPIEIERNVIPAEPPPQTPVLLDAGEIVLITGASGSGKSTLLRRIAHDLELAGQCVIDLANLPLPDAPVVDCFPDVPLEAALAMLGRMGLGEAWTYLRTPTELSDGQRWRLRLALAVHTASRHRNAVLVCDEFAALLDRLTAAVVSRAIRKLIDASPVLSAVVATCHDDVIKPLKPDRIVRCDFGETKTD